MSKTNEWSLLKCQFDALAHEKGVGPDSIEKIFDMEFRRRFSELVNRTRGLSRQNRTSALTSSIWTCFRDEPT